MSTILLILEIRYEQDVVLTRKMAREVAQALGFDAQDQARLATAVSEIARNAFVYAKGAIVEFSIDDESPQNLWISIQDKGSGIANLKMILDGQFTSKTGMGLGIIGAQRLMDTFKIESIPNQGTQVFMGKRLPKRLEKLTPQRLQQIQNELANRSPQNPFEEIQRQNQELLRAMEEIRKREEQLIFLNRELEDTNRGVVALYAELDEKADFLQRANELKTRFLSNMSHEFRTPLNSIISLSRILLERMDGDLTTDQDKQVRFVQKAAESLLDLVNDLLDLAKVEAGKTVVHPTQFEVTDLFATLRGMLRPLLAHNSSVALILEEPVGIPTLYTDEGKVAQILRNFISNGLKYTEQGEVRVGAIMTGNTVTFSVADTGIGIAPPDQERIFEEFIQIDSTLAKKLKGTGLGLPLSRKLAELLGGSVWVNSELSKGSTFFASIPLFFPDSSEASSISQPTWQIDPSRQPILVVEDNPQTIFTYEKYFYSSNYQMISARTLSLAKQALKVNKPVAIILDILLEGENSWAFLAETKSNAATRNIPIIVSTVVDNEKQAMARGADAFLIKPVDRLLLVDKLNTLVKQGKQQKLLLIDDDSTSRYVLKQLLVTTSLEIIEASDGHEGIRLAQLENPSCILLDLTMPSLSGMQVLEQLKSHPTTCTIPVIVNSSKQLEAEEEKYLAERTVVILSKQTPTVEVAITQLREALTKAGLTLNT
ncbi:histidine kinase [Brasilonema octagenarum UFV-E1]|uniref:histidine kinase n=1 Tax=Brasilonema sennae CENA114 TaxID=415709 RepID=A0A856MAC5_9CYAN|nr:ATP-binding protein [Brasilonema sennae]QDL06701.1 histidine kinase [Brasilonema sennae CENA114]QDL13070.1 histidine kinase [Brasilonema octagenarum UFV-E1]